MPFSLSDILSWTGGRLANAAVLGARADAIRVRRPAPLGSSQPDDIAFFFAREYQAELPHAKAGVVITGEAFAGPLEASGLPLWKSSAIITCADPYLAMALVSEKLAAGLSSVGPGGVGRGGVHPGAVVHPEAVLGPDVVVSPGCVIEEGARIGRGTRLDANCFIGPRAVIGEGCRLFASVVVYEWTQIGDRVRVHANTTIGSDGFGYAPRKGADGQPAGHQKIWHLGRVVIGDDVEVGANCSLDRGTMGDTVVGAHAKLDNQVHLGHNSRVGEGGIVCGGTCLAGGAIVGPYAYVGGLVGISNKVEVGAGAKVAALTLVSKDVPPGETAAGVPQREHSEHFRVHAMLNRLLSERAKGRKKE
jgi:UDP-3-O-[3-hydroxymyristoyl] glucosamine N-acyltransferase